MEELKVVITLRGDKGSMGIQSPGCDPVFSIHEGDLQCLLQTVPGKVEEARSRWESNPRYPRCQQELTPPTTAQTPPRQTTPRQQTRQQAIPGM